MANICENLLYFNTDIYENYEKVLKGIKQTLDPYEIAELGNCCCEMEFDSDWKFPQEVFQQLTDEIGKDDSLYIRVLSYEFGQDYVAYNIFEKGEWIDKLNH